MCPPIALDEADLSEVLDQVLPELFGAYGLAATPGPPPAVPAMIAAIAFEGPRSGCLRLMLDEAGAEALATSLLGGFPPEGPEERSDALGEWANIAAGNLKTRALDPRGPFRLGLPVVGAAPSPPPAGGTRRGFELPGAGHLEVALVLDPA